MVTTSARSLFRRTVFDPARSRLVAISCSALALVLILPATFGASPWFYGATLAVLLFGWWYVRSEHALPVRWRFEMIECQVLAANEDPSGSFLDVLPRSQMICLVGQSGPVYGTAQTFPSSVRSLVLPNLDTEFAHRVRHWIETDTAVDVDIYMTTVEGAPTDVTAVFRDEDWAGVIPCRLGVHVPFETATPSSN